MKSKLNRKPLILMIIGLFSIGAIQIISRYFELSDPVYGFLMGTCLGLMTVGIIKAKTKFSFKKQE